MLSNIPCEFTYKIYIFQTLTHCIQILLPFRLPSHVFYSQFLTTPQLSPPENHRTKCFYVIFYTRHMYVHIQHECMFLRIFAHFRVCFVAKLKQFDSITLCSSFHGWKVVGIHQEEKQNFRFYLVTTTTTLLHKCCSRTYLHTYIFMYYSQLHLYSQ